MLGIFLDLETTGLDCFLHRPLEIALKILNLHTGQTLCEYQNVLFQTGEDFNRSDPQSAKIHQIGRGEMALGVKRDRAGLEILALFQSFNIHRSNSLFICQNPSFDRPFFSQLIEVQEQERLHWPYHWLDLASMFWSLRLASASDFDSFEKVQILGNSLSKDEIARALKLPSEQQPHRAMQGVDHLIQCYSALVGFKGT